MDNHDHFITKCSGCGVILSSCRCSSPNKSIVWKLCVTCEKSLETEIDKITVEGKFRIEELLEEHNELMKRLISILESQNSILITISNRM